MVPKRRSAVTALINSRMLYGKWLNEKVDIDKILFEFSKAFDAVSHNLFFIKWRAYHAYGFNDRLLLRLTNFLYDSKQCVRVSVTTS